MNTPAFDFAFGFPDGAAPFAFETTPFSLLIECASGEMYELTVWTEAYLANVRERERESGERLGGQYLIAPDLVVASATSELIERTIAELLRTNGMREAWRIPDELTAWWGEDRDVADDEDDFDDTWQDRRLPEPGSSCGCCQLHPVE